MPSKDKKDETIVLRKSEVIEILKTIEGVKQKLLASLKSK